MILFARTDTHGCMFSTHLCVQELCLRGTKCTLMSIIGHVGPERKHVPTGTGTTLAEIPNSEKTY